MFPYVKAFEMKLKLRHKLINERNMYRFFQYFFVIFSSNDVDE
jgi:hypothetical protein